MTASDLTPEKKKQLIEFYKAIKMASKLIPRQQQTTMIVQMTDQIIAELKKEDADATKIQALTEKLQGMASAPL